MNERKNININTNINFGHFIFMACVWIDADPGEKNDDFHYTSIILAGGKRGVTFKRYIMQGCRRV